MTAGTRPRRSKPPLALDIETVPQNRAVDPELVTADPAWEDEAGPDLELLPELVRNGQVNLKETGQMAATHPLTCRVVSTAFGWLDKEAEGGVNADVVRWRPQKPYAELTEKELDTMEANVVVEALGRVARNYEKSGRLVTFNGKGFDLHVLRVRAMLLGLTAGDDGWGWIPWGKYLYPFSSEVHADLRLEFGNGNRFARGTFETWARAFGVTAKEAGHGSQVWDWIRADDFEKLDLYGLEEGEGLIHLYQKVKRYL